MLMRHRIESGRITSFKLEKSLLTVVFSLLALVMLSGCATAEERAARAAEQVAKVKIALTERKYKIEKLPAARQDLPVAGSFL